MTASATRTATVMLMREQAVCVCRRANRAHNRAHNTIGNCTRPRDLKCACCIALSAPFSKKNILILLILLIPPPFTRTNTEPAQGASKRIAPLNISRYALALSTSERAARCEMICGPSEFIKVSTSGRLDYCNRESIGVAFCDSSSARRTNGVVVRRALDDHSTSDCRSTSVRQSLEQCIRRVHHCSTTRGQQIENTYSTAPHTLGPPFCCCCRCCHRSATS